MLQLAKDLTRSELTDNTRNGRCVSCGDCCSNMVALTQADVSRIRQYMRRKHITEPEDHTRAYGPLNSRAAGVLDLTCPFLVIEKIGAAPGQQKASCRIYPVRPAVCRAFTCQIASDGSKMNGIYEKLKQDLTPTELMQLAKSSPVNMRSVFFGK